MIIVVSSALYSRPPRSAIVSQTGPLSQPSIADPLSFVFATDKFAIINEFAKWSEYRKLFSFMAYVAYTGTSLAGLTESSSIGPWVFDSEAIDHITGNKYLFSSLSSTNNLPSVTMANGSCVLAHDVGTVNIFLFLSIDNIFMSLSLHLTYYPLIV